jgi:hypothetical protein
MFMAHKHNFTEKNIRKLVADAGFDVLDSYLIPDNDAPFCNLALILQPSENPVVSTDRLVDPAQFSEADLEGMYRIGLPVNPQGRSALRFNVPHITNFYHILKSDRRNCKFDGEYVTYESGSK